jgi:hypothetical protein
MDNIPNGCTENDLDLLAWVRSTKCVCSTPKSDHSSFCRACYFALPTELRLELWRPWIGGFAEVYSQCIDYLETQTTRCQHKNTLSPLISTSNSNKATKESSGKSSRTPKGQKSASVQEISQLSDSQMPLLSLISTSSASDSTKSSMYQETMNITEVIRQVSSNGLDHSNPFSDLF